MKLLLIVGLSLLTKNVVYGDIGQHVLQDNNMPLTKSVAIIGGGASGTSTAFWLSNVFPSDGKIQVVSTIFEQSDFIGGRSTTVPIKGDDSLGTIELGASIFVEANKNLMTAAEKFNLELTQLTGVESARPGLGIWDGKELVFEQTGSYWDTIKAVWRYGFTPMKFQRKQKEVVEKFLELYDADYGFENIAKIVETLGFNSLFNQSASDYLKKLGVNERFSNEILQTATRGNYCQDLNTLHGLAVMVSMEASHGTWAVKDGNFRIFEEFAIRSKANVLLNTKVISVNNITEFDSFGNDVHKYAVETEDGIIQVFDEVVLAAPLRFSDIVFSFPTQHYKRDYHTVHVTLVSGHANPNYFGRNDIEKLPIFIVTTGHPLAQNFPDGKAPFETFSVHRILQNGETVVKIFSPNRLDEEQLDQLFLNRTWTYYKEWRAFPQLYPVENMDFPSFILKANEQDAFGIVYPGSFESFVSTMETQTISGKNAARLLHEKWCSKSTHCKNFGDGWGDY
ncbi:hypothetical protein MFLAVUS_010828 [Mucor flavus]|uniref:Prenylcysteine lyase domain-containing protein n=1 Tax=Mucor flavus TaxID=439312 RepID=A0ABP9ZDS8_9FUNG